MIIITLPSQNENEGIFSKKHGKNSKKKKISNLASRKKLSLMLVTRQFAYKYTVQSRAYTLAPRHDRRVF